MVHNNAERRAGQHLEIDKERRDVVKGDDVKVRMSLSAAEARSGIYADGVSRVKNEERGCAHECYEGRAPPSYGGELLS